MGPSERSIKVCVNDLNQIIRLNIGTNLKSGEECAIKLEPGKTKFPQLYYEAKLYKIFNGAGKFQLKVFTNLFYSWLA